LYTGKINSTGPFKVPSKAMLIEDSLIGK